MIAGVHNEVLLAFGYAAFLAGVGFALELLARHSHKRSELYRNAGFVYRQKLDLWECPVGRQLLRIETDYQRRIVHYRAPAEACNACSLKNNCTDSNDGRRLDTSLDSWLESELRRSTGQFLSCCCSWRRSCSWPRGFGMRNRESWGLLAACWFQLGSRR